MAILAQRKEDEQPAGNKKQQGGSNSSAYAKLWDAATEAYTLLVEYGSTMDWSTIGKEQGSISSVERRCRDAQAYYQSFRSTQN